jgi:hypothetical protein
VPENLTSILTLSIVKSMHTAISLKIFCQLYPVATPEQPNCLRLKKSRSRRRLTPDLQRVSFYRITDFLTTAAALSLYYS